MKKRMSSCVKTVLVGSLGLSAMFVLTGCDEENHYVYKSKDVTYERNNFITPIEVDSIKESSSNSSGGFGSTGRSISGGSSIGG